MDGQRVGGSLAGGSDDLLLEVDHESFVATVTLNRPPHNFFDTDLIRLLADTLLALDDDADCRAIVLAAAGKNFCGGRDFSRVRGQHDQPDDLYGQAARLLAVQTPWIAAVQGAAIGGGLGLALAADFRVASPDSRFAANFAMLGSHHGFGLTVLLPRVVGHQRAAELLYTGARVAGQQARELGLVDRLVDSAEVLPAATELARSIAGAAPLAVRAIRRTMRGDLAERFAAATDREVAEQARLAGTADLAEGVAAARDRRPPNFAGR